MTAKALHTRWVSVGHAAMETQGARPGGETPACEVAGPSGSYSIACSGHRGRMRVRGPGAGAPQLSTRGPPFTRALPPPPRGAGRGPGSCLRCLASCSANRKAVLRRWGGAGTAPTVMYLTSSFRFSPPIFFLLAYVKFSERHFVSAP